MCNSLREGKLPSCSNESELHAPDVVNMTFQLINTNFPGGLRVSTNESVSLLFVPLSILFTRIVSVFSWCYGGNSFPLRTLKPDWITYVQLRRFSLPKRAGLPVYKRAKNAIFSETFSFSARIFSSLDSEDDEERRLLAVDALLPRIRFFSTSPLQLYGEIKRAKFEQICATFWFKMSCHTPARFRWAHWGPGFKSLTSPHLLQTSLKI